jgi:hypothetical protein
MPFSTIRRSSLSLLVALALLLPAALPGPADSLPQTEPAALARAMQAAFERGGRNGWHYVDQVSYFSTVLDAGRAFEIARRSDPNNVTLKGYALDLAVRLNYDPLINRDAAAWYVRAAAESLQTDPSRGERARALLAKLDAEEADPHRLAADADADATANLAAYPGDAAARIDQVDADLRAFGISKDARFRSLALTRAALTEFPIGRMPPETSGPLWAAAEEAQRGGAGFDDADRAAARALAVRRAALRTAPPGAPAISHAARLVMTAPADQYFGQTRLSPLGVRNELQRISRYLDAGWGEQMTHDAMYAIDSLEDWRRQYPRDYEVPRLLLQATAMLTRIGSAEALSAGARLRRVLTVEYAGSAEARQLSAS